MGFQNNKYIRMIIIKILLIDTKERRARGPPAIPEEETVMSSSHKNTKQKEKNHGETNPIA